MIGVYIVPEIVVSEDNHQLWGNLLSNRQVPFQRDSRLDTKEQRNFARFIGTADQAEGVLWVTWEARVRHCRLVSNES